MKINFFKYQGTGNDFIILDNRKGEYNSLTQEQIKQLCNRRFGIGADGLMLLNTYPGYDFEMKYFNADGGQSTMCGNGGRCLVQFAHDIGIIKTDYKFIAVDGEHEGSLNTDGSVSLKMQDVEEIKEVDGYYILNTGSPHFVEFCNDVNLVDVFKKGRERRNSPHFKEHGINVNFVEQTDDPDTIKVRTYERGVENETLSCGTGVTAAAIVSAHNETGFNHVEVLTPGGKLFVEFDKIGESYRDVWLTGPAKKVFEGFTELPQVS